MTYPLAFETIFATQRMGHSDATSRDTDPLVGSILCGYELLKPLARRSVSGVYLALHTGGGTPVVVKVVFDEEMAGGRYERVLEALRGASHEHLLPIVAASRERGWLVVVSPYIGGGTLQDLRRARRLTGQRLRQLMFQVAGALDFLHGLEIVHRDVKPTNILVEQLSDDSVHVWLGDSWIAQLRREQITQEGVCLGTIGYAAPEQIAGERVDGRADVFAFAVVMWETLVGRRPFDRDNDAATLSATVNDPLPASGGLSVLVEAVLTKALSKRPVDRYATGHEFAEALWAALSADAAGASASSVVSPAFDGKWPVSPDALQPAFGPTAPPSGEPYAPVAPSPQTEEDMPVPGAATATGAWAVPEPSREPSDSPPAAPPPAVDMPSYAAPPPGVNDPLVLPQMDSPTIGDSDEDVRCSVFAPPTVARGDSCFVQVLVHLIDQAEAARAMAFEFDEDAQRRAVRRLALPVVRGTQLTFELRIGGLEVSDPIDSIEWLGDPASLGFEVCVPPDFSRSTVVGTVVVSSDSVPLGHVKFKLRIGDQTAGTLPAGVESHHYRLAFVSYASADRPEVLKRVQMLTPARLRIFQDFMSLDPGERWERELYKRIDECDVFLLFWSQHAKDSQWVRKEAEYARARQGPQGLDLPEFFPVILEGPPAPEPWEGFGDLHFDDRLMYLIATTRGERAPRWAPERFAAGQRQAAKRTLTPASSPEESPAWGPADC